MSKFSAALLAGAALLAFATHAAAQEVPASTQQPTTTGTTAPQQGSTDKTSQPDEAAQGDVVVTAQRRTERVVDVPISITVVNQAQLERQQVNTVADLARISPSLEIQQAPAQNVGGGGEIRGIGTQTFNNGAVGSVGIVVDQISQGNANIADIFDVGRIEILKGPQGTLFGLTTSAGVINITTNAPDPTKFSAHLHSELGGDNILGSGYGRQIVQGVVNIPVSENSALRVSGILNRTQGVDRNTLRDGVDALGRYSFRGRYLWTPTDKLTINIIGDYASEKDIGEDFFTFIKTDAATTALLASCGVTPKVGNQDYCTNRQNVNRSNGYGGSLQLDYDAGPFVITSISAYRRSQTGVNTGGNVFRADPLPLQVLSNGTLGTVDLFTQELRLSSSSGNRLEYTVGAFYSKQLSKNHPEFFSVTLSPFPGLVIPIISTPGAEVDVRDESMAVFGQATYHLTDAFRVIAGARYTDDSLKVNRFDFGTGQASNPHTDYGNFSWRGGLQYDLNHNTMAYATVSRGFKGAQIAIPSLPALPYVIRPEIPTDYEAGIKSTILGGLIVDINAFYTKVRDYQGSLCASDPVTGALSCNQINIDGVKTRGGEIDFFGRPFKGMSLNTGLIYAKATYPSNYIGTDGSQIGGTQLANAPKWKFTAAGEYEHPVTSGINAFLGIDAVYKSRVRYEATSYVDSTFHPHWIAGGRIGVRDASDRFSVAVFARNLFNEHEPLLIQSGFPSGQNYGAIYGPQSYRLIGISLDARF